MNGHRRYGARFGSLALCAIALCLGGCGTSGQDNLAAYAARVRARPAGRIPAIPKAVPYTADRYDPAGQRDPFMPSRAQDAGLGAQGSAGNGLHPDFSRPQQPLQQYPLDALQMVGILAFAGTRYAMISAPDGVIHRVTVGDYIGQHYGQVVSIDSALVKLKEMVPDGFGGWRYQAAQLARVNEQPVKTGPRK